MTIASQKRSGLSLAVGVNLKANCLIERDVWAGIEAEKRHPQHSELDGEFVTPLAGGTVGRCRKASADMAVGEGRSVEFGRLASLAVVEPQAGRDLVLADVHDGASYA